MHASFVSVLFWQQTVASAKEVWILYRYNACFVQHQHVLTATRCRSKKNKPLYTECMLHANALCFASKSLPQQNNYKFYMHRMHVSFKTITICYKSGKVWFLYKSNACVVQTFWVLKANRCRNRTNVDSIYIRCLLRSTPYVLRSNRRLHQNKCGFCAIRMHDLFKTHANPKHISSSSSKLIHITKNTSNNIRNTPCKHSNP